MSETQTTKIRPTGKVHDLKTWPDFFSGLLTGTKEFEIRRDDRGFEVGDELLLREWEPTTGIYSGRCVRLQIKYITSAFLPLGMRVLGLQPLEPSAPVLSVSAFREALETKVRLWKERRNALREASARNGRTNPEHSCRLDCRAEELRKCYQGIEELLARFAEARGSEDR